MLPIPPKEKKYGRICVVCGAHFLGGFRHDKPTEPVKCCSFRCRGILAGRSAQENQSRVGEKNPRWKGGISKQPYHYAKLAKAKDPARWAAMGKVAYAIRTGKLLRGPCVDCGWIGKTHGHHEDYRQPLTVVWLCPPCHRKRHKKIKRRRLREAVA